MCLLLETICIENRQIRNAEYHNRRLNRSRNELLGISAELDLRHIIKIPAGMGTGTYKCRVIYDRKIREVQILPYQPGTVESLKIVEDNEIDYRYKYADRRRLEQLLSLKGDCDDILILKDGYLTDTSYSNIVFREPDGSWVTPANALLRGTMRQYLLEQGDITEAEIKPADLTKFNLARLINCMMDLDTGFVVEIKNIMH